MKNSKKTLVILSPGFPGNEMDSTCLPAQQALVRSFNTQYPHLQIFIISFQYPYTSTTYKWHGNTVIPIGGRNRNKLFRLLVWYKAWCQLKKIQRREKVTGILSFWLGECAMIGHFFSKRNKLSHFTWLLGQDARPGNGFAKRIRFKGESLVAISDLLSRNFHENYGIRPEHIIPNGIEPSLFPAQKNTRDIDIIGVGSLIPLKRYDLFIEAIKEIRPFFPALKVMVCGKGPEQIHLEALISDNELGDTIQLAGEKTHLEVLQLMQRSKLMLHTSSYEGFSGACLEALFAGAHVISFINPQDAWIKHWHIVDNRQAMIDKALQILRVENPDHSPILPYEMKDTAAAFIQLFTR